MQHQNPCIQIYTHIEQILQMNPPPPPIFKKAKKKKKKDGLSELEKVQFYLTFQ